MSNRYQLPDDDEDVSPLVAWFRMILMGLALGALLYALGCARAARGQEVLLPCYEPTVATQALKACPKGKEKSLVLLMNVNSGPHWVRDVAYGGAVEAARQRGIAVSYYVDALAGPGYSPVLLRNGDFWKLVPVTRARDKTAMEIRNERDAWLRFYGPAEPSAEALAKVIWFVDDVRPRHAHLFAELAKWKGRVILNPGTAMPWPVALPACTLVIHESESGWPRQLTRSEEKRRGQCGVLGLSISAGALDRFVGTTAGMALRYASPLSDQEGAYNRLTPYLGRLLR